MKAGRLHITSLLFGMAFANPTWADEITALSLDYCADQYLLSLADESQIMALTKGSMGADSFYREKAKQFPKYSATAAEVLALKPALAVETWTANPRLKGLVNSVKTKLITTKYGTDFNTMFDNILLVGEALGQGDKANSKVAGLKEKLAVLKSKQKSSLMVAYLTPSGYTAGLGTIVDDVIKLAGFETYAGVKGFTSWQPLPMEQLVMSPPDVVLTSFFDTDLKTQSRWSLARHDKINQMMEALPRLDLEGKYFACSGLFAIDAAYELRKRAEEQGLINKKVGSDD